MATPRQQGLRVRTCTPGSWWDAEPSMELETWENSLPGEQRTAGSAGRRVGCSCPHCSFGRFNWGQRVQFTTCQPFGVATRVICIFAFYFFPCPNSHPLSTLEVIAVSLQKARVTWTRDYTGWPNFSFSVATVCRWHSLALIWLHCFGLNVFYILSYMSHWLKNTGRCWFLEVVPKHQWSCDTLHHLRLHRHPLVRHRHSRYPVMVPEPITPRSTEQVSRSTVLCLASLVREGSPYSHFPDGACCA